VTDPRLDAFPSGFFRRSDEADDAAFYEPVRLVTHIDDAAIAAVGTLYRELRLHECSPVLDLMSSWISHFDVAPSDLTVLGMNSAELDRNEAATERVVHDLNAHPRLPFEDTRFAGACCAVSVDYLTRPLEVFDDVARVLQPDAPFVCTFSNRCFPTKAISGWLRIGEHERPNLVATYFRLSHGWGEPVALRCPTPPGADPLWAVWARRLTAGVS
jgi:SAM-dependent methyltransferase